MTNCSPGSDQKWMRINLAFCCLPSTFGSSPCWEDKQEAATSLPCTALPPALLCAPEEKWEGDGMDPQKKAVACLNTGVEKSTELIYRRSCIHIIKILFESFQEKKKNKTTRSVQIQQWLDWCISALHTPLPVTEVIAVSSVRNFPVLAWSLRTILFFCGFFFFFPQFVKHEREAGETQVRDEGFTSISHSLNVK